MVDFVLLKKEIGGNNMTFFLIAFIIYAYLYACFDPGGPSEESIKKWNEEYYKKHPEITTEK